MSNTSGWKSVPPALLVAAVVAIVLPLINLALVLAGSFEAIMGPRHIFTSQGISTATLVLALMGTAELSARVAGTARRGVLLAAASLGVALLGDAVLTLLEFSREPWEHRSLYVAYSYVSSACLLAFPAGLTVALPPRRRVVGYIAILVVLVTWPLPPLRDTLWSALELEHDARFAVQSVMMVVREAAMLGLVIAVATGTTTPDRAHAAAGFRLAAKALWIRVIAAVVIALLTVMMMASRGGAGAMETFRLALMAQGVVAMIALAMLGVGALRAARASLPELGTWTLTLGGTAALWATGVTYGQLPYLYRMLYRPAEDYGMGREYAQALSLASPIAVIVGVGLLATALAGYAARRGMPALRAAAQGKGVGFVALMLVAVAIQSWLLPQTRSVGSAMALTLFAAGAALAATVMIAKLFGAGAEAIEHEPALPAASVVSGGSSDPAP